MLYPKYSNRKRLTSKMLTVAIISSVVLVNTVAWGLPLLVGRDHRTSPHVVSGAVSAAVSTAGVVGVAALKMPLPHRAPSMPIVQASIALPVINEQLTPAPAAAPLTPEFTLLPPATLFPRAQDASELRESAELREQEPGHRGPATIARGPFGTNQTASRPQKIQSPAFGAAHDVVLASPYTPGVRVTPEGRGLEWRHRNPRFSNGETNLEVARAIANRAAERFEQTRGRIASLDGRSGSLSMQDQARQRGLLPIVPQPPRMVVNAWRKSGAESASGFVRPRLDRRPLPATVPEPPPYDPDRFSVASLQPAVKSVREQQSRKSEPEAPTSASAVRLPKPEDRGADLPELPVRSAVIARKREEQARPETNRIAKSSRRVVRVHRIRSGEVRVVRRQQPPRQARKIDGFKRSFHRQLVASNFFNSQN